MKNATSTRADKGGSASIVNKGGGRRFAAWCRTVRYQRVRPRALSLALYSVFAGGAANMALPPTLAWANPQGAQVVQGQASMVTQGNKLTITNTPGTAINWQSFSINANELTHFQQANSASSVLNRVISNNPSQLLGTLTSNGKVVLVNPFGITVGKGAAVDTAGFTASTLNISDKDWAAGKLRFEGNALSGGVQVDGTIRANGGDIVLFAPNVQVGKDALVRAENGDVIVGAGQKVEVTGRGLEGLRFHIQGASDTATNLGTLKGDAVGVFAGTLRNHGVIEAQNVQNVGGRIVLRAVKDVEIGAGAKVLAEGGAGKAGGQIAISSQSGNISIAPQAVISANGGAGAAGGTVAITSEQARVTVEPFAAITADGAIGGAVRIFGALETRVSGVVSALSPAGAATGSVSVNSSKGGKVELLGERVSLNAGASVDVSGDSGGGVILVGGDLQGKNPDVPNAKYTDVAPGVVLSANGRAVGDGGKIIVWAEEATHFSGALEARGGEQGGNGGFGETSGKKALYFRGTADLSARRGRTGTLLLDPDDIVIAGGTGTDDPDAPTGMVTVYEANLEALTADVNLVANNSITTSGAFTDGLNFTNPLNVSLSTLNPTAGGSSPGINLGNVALSVNGSITLSTGGNSGANPADILVSTLSATGAINVTSSGGFSATGNVTTAPGVPDVNAGAITISTVGNISLGGTVSSIGFQGAGAGGAGAHGGAIRITASGAGSTIAVGSGGTILSRGGDGVAGASGAGFAGGSGGSITLQAGSGTLVLAGGASVRSVGGAGSSGASDGSAGGAGGAGGNIALLAQGQTSVDSGAMVASEGGAGGSGGSLSTTGDAGSGGAGGTAGTVQVRATGSGGTLALASGSVVGSFGGQGGSGGTGGAGGAGGTLHISAGGALNSAGTVASRGGMGGAGGNGSASSGGDGGQGGAGGSASSVSSISTLGTMAVSGTIESRGGDGGAGGGGLTAGGGFMQSGDGGQGGAGAGVNLVALGNLSLSGALVGSFGGSGGAGGAGGVNESAAHGGKGGQGGAASTANVTSDSGGVTLSNGARVFSLGGAGGAGGSPVGHGMDGSAATEGGLDPDSGDPVPGSLSTVGGAGADGGDGGMGGAAGAVSVNIRHSTSIISISSSEIASRGGAGGAGGAGQAGGAGGDGVNVAFNATNSGSYGGNGGAGGSGGGGGAAGNVEVVTNSLSEPGTPGGITMSRATVRSLGGQGGAGGAGGDAGASGTSYKGALLMGAEPQNGAAGAGGSGGNAAAVTVSSANGLSLTDSTVLSAGGNGLGGGDGGDAGNVGLSALNAVTIATSITRSSLVQSRGGDGGDGNDAVAGGMGGQGGNAGSVWIASGSGELRLNALNNLSVGSFGGQGGDGGDSTGSGLSGAGGDGGNSGTVSLTAAGTLRATGGLFGIMSSGGDGGHSGSALGAGGAFPAQWDPKLGIHVT